MKWPEKTERGFGVVNFKDIYGADCSFQESSLATKRACWLGGEEPYECDGELHNTRIHIDEALAKRIVKWLVSYFEIDLEKLFGQKKLRKER